MNAAIEFNRQRVRVLNATLKRRLLGTDLGIHYRLQNGNFMLRITNKGALLLDDQLTAALARTIGLRAVR